MGHDPDYTTQVCLKTCPPTLCDVFCNPPIYPPPLPPPIYPPPPPQESPDFFTIVTVITTCALLSICICPCLTKQCTQASTSSSPTAPSPTNNIHEDHVQTHNPVDHRLDVTTSGVGESLLNSINVCRYKGGDGLVAAKECAVCLNEFRDGENLRLLPKCLHAFHVSCIDMWFESRVNCPLCRTDVIPSPLISMPKDTGSSTL